MSYSQDTIVDANAANVFALMLDGLLIDAGWSVVESLTPSGTYRTKVYKSAGAGNAAGYDWYLALMWNTVGTEQQVQIIAGSEYNLGTHSLFGIPGQFGGNPATPSGYWLSAYNVNVNVDTTSQISLPNLMQKPWFAVIIPSSAFGYWASVTRDHVGVYTTIPGFFFASTLDVDAAWSAQPFDVIENPVVSFSGNNLTNTSYTGNDGINGAMKNDGVGSLANFTHRTRPVGSKLPILAGHYLPAYAWKSAWYLDSATGQDGSGTPIWDSPTFGDGLHIGDAIDYYNVYGGNVGDTVEIDGSTYVLSGLVPTPNPGQIPVYIGLLVE